MEKGLSFRRCEFLQPPREPPQNLGQLEDHKGAVVKRWGFLGIDRLTEDRAKVLQRPLIMKLFAGQVLKSQAFEDETDGEVFFQTPCRCRVVAQEPV